MSFKDVMSKLYAAGQKAYQNGIDYYPDMADCPDPRKTKSEKTEQKTEKPKKQKQNNRNQQGQNQIYIVVQTPPASNQDINENVYRIPKGYKIVPCEENKKEIVVVCNE